jgi:hypothetical protein
MLGEPFAFDVVVAQLGEDELSAFGFGVHDVPKREEVAALDGENFADDPISINHALCRLVELDATDTLSKLSIYRIGTLK